MSSTAALVIAIYLIPGAFLAGLACCAKLFRVAAGWEKVGYWQIALTTPVWPIMVPSAFSTIVLGTIRDARHCKAEAK